MGERKDIKWMNWVYIMNIKTKSKYINKAKSSKKNEKEEN